MPFLYHMMTKDEWALLELPNCHICHSGDQPPVSHLDMECVWLYCDHGNDIADLRCFFLFPLIL